MSNRPGFGLYVHWPFCQAKCPYCDFNSHVVSSVDQKRWLKAFLSEITRVCDETKGRVLDTIYFGGGTPSLMAADTVGAIIEAARAAWTPSNDMEVTLEANPTSVEASRFREYAHSGVNRVSVGVQSFRDKDLRALGRLHSAKEALVACEVARKYFPRISFDLIYARQNQSLADWRTELGEALDFAVDHLSLYQLTVEPGTAFGDRLARGRLPGLPDEDLGADMFALTQEMTSQAGLPAYEVSNHATPGAESRHNLIYWRSGDWAGVGPGAHGRLTTNGRRIATETHLEPHVWLHAVEELGTGEKVRNVLNSDEFRDEAVLMGLRLTEGIPIRLLDKHHKINDLTECGVLEIADGHIRTTKSGRPLLNAILRELLT